LSRGGSLRVGFSSLIRVTYIQTSKSRSAVELLWRESEGREKKKKRETREKQALWWLYT